MTVLRETALRLAGLCRWVTCVRRWARRCEAQPELILEGPGSPRGAA